MTQEKLTTINGHGDVRRLQTQVSIATDIYEVWSAITDDAKIAQWWTTAKIDRFEGGRIVLDDGAELNGTVRTFAAPYIFEFTWRDNPADAVSSQMLEFTTKSLVRFDLVPLEEKRTLLTVVQFAPVSFAHGAAAGWHHLAGERLVSYLEQGCAVDEAGRFETLKSLYSA